MESSPPPTSIRTTQCAIIQDVAGKPFLTHDASVPELRPGTVLVETLAVALNPSDYKMGAAFPSPGATVGSDFVGHVVSIMAAGGDDDTTTHLRLGDMVCGQVYGSDPVDLDTGAFAQYVRAPINFLLRVPDHVLPTRAVTLGMPLLTSCVALWGSLRLPGTPAQPSKDAHPVLVYGGSTAIGTMAIQLLKLSGFDPIATSSPHNFALVRSFGASAVYDHARSGIGPDIRTDTKGRLRYALDCITDQTSVACCYSALGRPGGRYACLEHCPPQWKTREAVKAEFIMAPEALGREVQLEGDYWRAANAKMHRLVVDMYRVMQELLDSGKLRPHPAEIVGHGLQDVLEGLRVLKSGTVSGKRLVVSLE